MSAIKDTDVTDLLERADHAHTPEAAQAFATAALVHQVAALTEQQRISNLIALGQYRIVPTDLAPHRSVIFDPPRDEWDTTLRGDVREGLGLE